MIQSRVLRNIPIINKTVDFLGRLLGGRRASLGIPTEPNVFRPFGPNVSYWSKANELQRLHHLITNSANAHIIVTDTSGAGKSTLVTELYRKEYVMGPCTTIGCADSR